MTTADGGGAVAAPSGGRTLRRPIWPGACARGDLSRWVAQAVRGADVGRSNPSPDGRAASVPELPENALPGYRYERLLAQSSRFEVHRAWSEARSVPVAVKFARPGAGADATARLAREGGLLLGLAHPNLVRAYEVHQTAYPAVVLELLPGPTLGELFQNHGRLKIREAVEMGRQIGSALGYLHGLGWLHCDIKPRNVLAVHGRAVVIDLSLARRPGRYGRRHGTQGYLAPEQCEREDVSPATDVWGLGLLLFEAVSGRDPYPPDCAEYRDEHGPLAPPPPPRWPRAVPVALRELIGACTAYDPRARPCLAEVMTILHSLA